MKVAFSLLSLSIGWPGLVASYKLSTDQSAVYKKAIQKSLNKKMQVVGPIKSTATATVDLPLPSRTTSNPNVIDTENYWFNPKIHMFGNTGFLGGLHAAVAPLATLLIDHAAYSGENVRDGIASDLRRLVGKSGANVADLCCGVGTSTRALRKQFGDANCIVGIDTSPEMIAMAEVLSSGDNNMIAKLIMMMTNNNNQKSSHLAAAAGCCDATTSFSIGNAENTNLPPSTFDLVTIMYGFHEVPFLGRDRIIREARRLLAPGATLAVIDISPDYQPSPTMLAGEPFVLEYKENVSKQLRAAKGFVNCKYKEIVKGHVGLWLLKKNVLQA